MYFTIPTYGNIWFTYIVKLLFQAKSYSDLQYRSYCTAVWNPVHPLSYHLDSLDNVTIMHQVMQGTYIQSPCKSSLWPCNQHTNVCMSGIITLYISVWLYRYTHSSVIGNYTSRGIGQVVIVRINQTFQPNLGYSSVVITWQGWGLIYWRWEGQVMREMIDDDDKLLRVCGVTWLSCDVKIWQCNSS